MALRDRADLNADELLRRFYRTLQGIDGVKGALVKHYFPAGLTPVVTASVVSLSGGAMLANVVSVVLLIIETVMLRR
jgi:hypothetical protein